MKPRPVPQASTPVEALMNLSQVSAGWLREEGVCSYADLQAADLVALWLRLKAKHPQVTRLMYYALWGALRNTHWNQIPEEEKARVRELVSSNVRGA